MFLDLQVGNLTEPISGRAWDRAEVVREVALRVARYQGRGLARGDRVFLPFGNRLEFFAELLAIWRLGACAVPIDARLTAFEITTLVGAASPRLAVVDEATDATVVTALADAGVLTLQTVDTGTQQSSVGLSRLDDDALILFTSGSTGAP
ncbi:MAG: AMP-binding protein, partial [Burkholderiaceae bacterium]